MQEEQDVLDGVLVNRYLSLLLPSPAQDDDGALSASTSASDVALVAWGLDTAALAARGVPAHTARALQRALRGRAQAWFRGAAAEAKWLWSLAGGGDPHVPLADRLAALLDGAAANMPVSW
jgi:hypothetical protein